METGANFCELFGLLENYDGVTGHGAGNSGRETTEASADDNDVEVRVVAALYCVRNDSKVS